MCERWFCLAKSKMFSHVILSIVQTAFCVYSVWKRRRPAHTQYTHDEPSSHPIGPIEKFRSQAGLLTIYIQFRAKNLKSMTSEISCQCTFKQGGLREEYHFFLASNCILPARPCFYRRMKAALISQIFHPSLQVTVECRILWLTQKLRFFQAVLLFAITNPTW